jgi:hypothetical protein
VFEIVAVAQEHARKIFELHQHARGLALQDKGSILPAIVYKSVTQGLISAGLIGIQAAFDHLELHALNVHGARL